MTEISCVFSPENSDIGLSEIFCRKIFFIIPAFLHPSIGHFGKYDNTLCLSPHILHIKHCVCFLLGPLEVPRKTGNNAYSMQNLGWQTRVPVLWYFPKWPIACLQKFFSSCWTILMCPNACICFLVIPIMAFEKQCDVLYPTDSTPWYVVRQHIKNVSNCFLFVWL